MPYTNIKNLAENPECFNQVKLLIEKEFNYTEEFSYELDFPQLLTPHNYENCFFILEEESREVVSTLLISKRQMIFRDKLLPVIMLGGIATHHLHRKKGLFKSLINYIVENFSHDIGFFILWSNLDWLYEKYSFYPAGAYIETSPTPLTIEENIPKFTRYQFNELTDEDFFQIKYLYQTYNEKSFFTIHRTDHDWDIIRNYQSPKIYIQKDDEQKILAYFIVGKGMDLPGVIHEIGAIDDATFFQTLKILDKYKTWISEFIWEKFPLNNHHGTKYFFAHIRIANENILFNFFNKQINSQNLQEHLGPNILTENDRQYAPWISGLDSI